VSHAVASSLKFNSDRNQGVRNSCVMLTLQHGFYHCGICKSLESGMFNCFLLLFHDQ